MLRQLPCVSDAHRDIPVPTPGQGAAPLTIGTDMEAGGSHVTVLNLNELIPNHNRGLARLLSEEGEVVRSVETFRLV